MAGKLLKNAGPRAKRFVEENRPRLEKAVQDARPKVEKAIEEARPRIEKAVEQYRPKVEEAGRNALKYAEEHEEEIRAMAIKGARMRLGPLGMAIDALGIGSEPERPATEAPPGCPQCGKANQASAKFCSECGTRLQVA